MRLLERDPVPQAAVEAASLGAERPGDVVKDAEPTEAEPSPSRPGNRPGALSARMPNTR